MSATTARQRDHHVGGRSTGRPLPPGQVEVRGFPRFGTHLTRPAPRVPANPCIEITGAVTSPILLPVAELVTMPRRELDADFNCVSGWTATGLRWEGVPFATVYRTLIEPRLVPGAAITQFVFTGLDGHESALLPEDALAEDVLLADQLNDEPLDRDHGAPVRLFSPDQYGYMSTKHLCRIEVRTSARRPGAAHPIAAVGLRGPFVLRHPRARVWEEERHPFLPASVLRPFYRRIIPVGVRIAADRGTHRRVPDAEHHAAPWRIHEITEDFRVEDVWELPGSIRGEEFPRLVDALAAMDLADSRSAAVRLLVAVRLRLGELLRLDRPGSGVGDRVASLHERLADDLRDGPRGPRPTALPATPLFQTDDEYAIEVANETVHGVLHLGRLPDGEGRFHVRLAILVRPNGILGRLYLAGIRPFRHLVIYPALLPELAEHAATADDEGRRGQGAALGSVGPMASKSEETRDGVSFSNLDKPLWEGAGATKRELVDYLDGVRDRILPELTGRPLSVIRVHRGDDAFMQKNVPKYTPDFVRTVSMWAETSKRKVNYALCNDRPTLLWFANQRAVEYHPTLVTADDLEHPTHLVLDLDPPGDGDGAAAFRHAAQAALLVRQVLVDLGLEGAVKTSGAKGVHVFVPVDGADHEQAAAATRAIAERAAALDPAIATTAFVKDDREGKVFVDSTRVGGATVVAAYSPRVRPGVPVSFPVGWDDLEAVKPSDHTIQTALEQLGERDPWAEQLPAPQRLPDDLVEEGRAIPVARVQAMHEGKRRARARATDR